MKKRFIVLTLVLSLILTNIPLSFISVSAEEVSANYQKLLDLIEQGDYVYDLIKNNETASYTTPWGWFQQIHIFNEENPNNKHHTEIVSLYEDVYNGELNYIPKTKVLEMLDILYELADELPRTNEVASQKLAYFDVEQTAKLKNTITVNKSDTTLFKVALWFERTFTDGSINSITYGFLDYDNATQKALKEEFNDEEMSDLYATLFNEKGFIHPLLSDFFSAKNTINSDITYWIETFDYINETECTAINDYEIWLLYRFYWAVLKVYGYENPYPTPTPTPVPTQSKVDKKGHIIVEKEGIYPDDIYFTLDGYKITLGKTTLGDIVKNTDIDLYECIITYSDDQSEYDYSWIDKIGKKINIKNYDRWADYLKYYDKNGSIKSKYEKFDEYGNSKIDIEYSAPDFVYIKDKNSNYILLRLNNSYNGANSETKDVSLSNSIITSIYDITKKEYENKKGNLTISNEEWNNLNYATSYCNWDGSVYPMDDKFDNIMTGNNSLEFVDIKITNKMSQQDIINKISEKFNDKVTVIDNIIYIKARNNNSYVFHRGLSKGDSDIYTGIYKSNLNYYSQKKYNYLSSAPFKEDNNTSYNNYNTYMYYCIKVNEKNIIFYQMYSSTELMSKKELKQVAKDIKALQKIKKENDNIKEKSNENIETNTGKLWISKKGFYCGYKNFYLDGYLLDCLTWNIKQNYIKNVIKNTGYKLYDRNNKEIDINKDKGVYEDKVLYLCKGDVKYDIGVHSDYNKDYSYIKDMYFTFVQYDHYDSSTGINQYVDLSTTNPVKITAKNDYYLKKAFSIKNAPTLNNFKEEFMKKLSGDGKNSVYIRKLDNTTGYKVSIPLFSENGSTTKYLIITYKYDSKTRKCIEIDWDFC